MATVHAVGRLGSKSGEPAARVVVAACGEATMRRSNESERESAGAHARMETPTDSARDSHSNTFAR